MGDPKKLRKKYQTARHPWRKDEIDEFETLRKEYGLRGRKEILIAQTFLKKYKDIAKKLIPLKSAQSEKEKLQVLGKLQKLGLLSTDAKLDQILSLAIKDVLDRRIQSLVCTQGLARTMTQARQFIVHRHITIDKREITSPSHLVLKEEEGLLAFKEKSTLADQAHPERVNESAKIREEAEQLKSQIKEGSNAVKEKPEDEVSKEIEKLTEPTVEDNTKK